MYVNNVKISVIMGIYNCSSTLDEAIGSLLNQTYKDWELIMCDDGSTDNTFEIAECYAKKYSNIHLYRNDKNMGLNYTLNKCLGYANGKYIARMDGDDISLPERFEKEIDFLESNKEYSIVSTPMEYFDNSGVFSVGKGGKEPSVKSFPKGTPFCHAPCMVKREAYDAVGGYSVSPKLLRVEDWHLWIKMYSNGYKGYILDEPLYMMRDDRDAVNRRNFKSRINEARVSLLAVKMLKLPVWMGIYSLRPIIVGLLPLKLYTYLHKNRNKFIK